MTIKEKAFFFKCEGDELLGLVSEPQSPVSDIGVLIIVGGPQYRVGSHRQFVLLARHLAAQGIACMRFDYRGMGDADGVQRDFENVNQDIQAAIDAFFNHAQSVKRIVLWGLCDGASAACFYAPLDQRVAGLVLLNPWVKTVQGEARTYLRHYYLKRLLDPSFWKKLLSGRVSIGRTIGEVADTAKAASTSSNKTAVQSLAERMGQSLSSANLPFHLILSGNDYVAREFESVMSKEPWRQLLEKTSPSRIEAADHTFSRASWRDEVAEISLSWIGTL